jgi:indolepyruvate ferredoxin oxidoreductase alpha subunit
VAERSFKKEVEKLRLGAGEEFHGEGILAVTKALLQSRVSYLAGYQGSPISHLMDVLTDANEILDELGAHFEHSASEATAAATLAASVIYPLRGAITFKSTVGTNVASDALAKLASGVINSSMSVVGHDDLHVYRAMQEGLRANGNEWVSLHRDFARSEPGQDDLTARGTSEISMRNQFRAWRKYMTPMEA